MCKLCILYPLENSVPFNQQLPKTWKRVMQQLYDGTLQAGDASPELCMLMAKEMFRGVDAGGLKFDITDPSQTRKLKALQENIFYFSGFKSQKELKEASLLLTDDKGNVKPFSTFFKDVSDINTTYNESYLKAEYNHAVTSSQMIQRWEDIIADKEDFPLLKYQTAHDERVRDSHRVLDNVTKPVEDPFWKTYYPPNGWNCRCHVIKLSHGENSGDYVAPKIEPMFKTNVGIEGIIFPDTHPYFEASKQEVHKVAEVVIPLLSNIDSGAGAYKKLLKEGYVHQFFDNSTGGFVVSHPEHGADELEDNIIVGKFYAHKGLQVVLQKRIDDKNNVKSFDALIGKMRWEFKAVTSINKSTIQSEIREGSKQAPNVSFYFKNTPPVKEAIRYVRLSKKHGYFNRLTRLDFIINDKIISLSKKEVLKGSYVNKLLWAYKNKKG
jgi:SPP1 gp7 family putative phage head morphogenesis protein